MIRQQRAVLVLGLVVQLVLSFPTNGPTGGVVLLGETPGTQLKQQADGVEAYDAALLGLTFPSKRTEQGGDVVVLGQSMGNRVRKEDEVSPTLVQEVAAAKAKLAAGNLPEPQKGMNKTNLFKMDRLPVHVKKEDVQAEAQKVLVAHAEEWKNPEAMAHDATEKAMIDEDAAKDTAGDVVKLQPEEVKPLKGQSIKGFSKLAKITLGHRDILLRKQTKTLAECQQACQSAVMCKAVEYSENEGGICILIKAGVRWSNAFTFYEKDTPDVTDPDVATKRDQQLLWGRDMIPEGEKDLGGLRSDDVPGSSVYVPPTAAEQKKQLNNEKEVRVENAARVAIGERDRELEIRRLTQSYGAQAALKNAKMKQTRLFMMTQRTRDSTAKMAKKRQEIEKYSATQDMHAAKLHLSAANLRSRATKLNVDLIRAESEADQYQKAAKLFVMAENPEANNMQLKMKKAQKRVAALKDMSTQTKADARIELAQANEADIDATHWRKQLVWAQRDEEQARQGLQKQAALTATATAALPELTATYTKAAALAKEMAYKEKQPTPEVKKNVASVLAQLAKPQTYSPGKSPTSLMHMAPTEEATPVPTAADEEAARELTREAVIAVAAGSADTAGHPLPRDYRRQAKRADAAKMAKIETATPAWGAR